MASFFLTQPLILTTSIPKTSFRNKSLTPNNTCDHAKRKSKALSPGSSIFSCMASRDGNHDDQQNPTTNETHQSWELSRRNVMFGLGGLYGSMSTCWMPSEHPLSAIAAPIPPPDISTCHDVPKSGDAHDKVNCCPPEPTIIDYVPPPVTCLRVRRPAHRASCEYIAKYNKATELMKNLPLSDPRSFMQQANVHCTYCDGAYYQAGLTENIPLCVHNSWLFFPFHRWYVYFYEKILGNLIGDPTFALPFWNWDHQDGMQIPDMYTDKSSALYDVLRSTAHQPPATVDLNYVDGKAPQPREKQVKENLCVMHRSMVSGAKLPQLFFGSPYRLGTTGCTCPGTIEQPPHNSVHRWTGSENTPRGEDMGIFYAAGRDPIFFAHHANVDRMWSIWKTLDGRKRQDIKERDFLDAGFLFYDENARLVRVKIRDCLNTEALGYVYERVELPWKDKKFTPYKHKSAEVGKSSSPEVELTTKLPIHLKGRKAVTAVVPRPKKARSKEEKEEEEEVLVLEGIGFDTLKPVKFDVYVNNEYAPGPEYSEFAGSFVNVPHAPCEDHYKHNLAITELLDEIEADNDDEIKVTLVPMNDYEITIEGIRIELLS